MVLDVKLSRQVRRLVNEASEEKLSGLPSFTSATLAGALEVAISSSSSPSISSIVDRSLDVSIKEMREIYGRYDFGEEHFEIESLPGVAEARSVRGVEKRSETWTNFLVRYIEALSREGFSANLARGLAVAFEEMADNVNRHSGEKGGPVPRHLAVWQVSGGQSCIALVDEGIGIRRSLARNPLWADLPDDKVALSKAVQERATSIALEIEGNGFDTFTSNFLALGGRMSVTSGTGTIDLSGTIDSKHAMLSSSSRFDGTMIFAACSAKGANVIL